MEAYCRGCLVKYEEPADLFQYTEKSRRLFIYSTGIQVKRNDAFAFQLCKECYAGMKYSCKFKKQCRTSDKRLKNYLMLKETADSQEFNTILKNNDNLLMKFPALCGTSTPRNQKAREDDNESTCTSIRNFISDMVPPELPDENASIVRELIQEEADILDESLDSHWLEDDADMSVGSEYRLDLSVSPFKTPHAGERYFTPSGLRLDSLDTSQDREKIKNIAKEIMNELDPKQDTSLRTSHELGRAAVKHEIDEESDNKIAQTNGLPYLDVESDIENTEVEASGKKSQNNKENLLNLSYDEDDNRDALLEGKVSGFNKSISEGKTKNSNNFDKKGIGKNIKLMKLYADTDNQDERISNEDSIENETNKERSLNATKDLNKMNFYVESDFRDEDVIDKNLEEALRNGEEKEYLLDDIIYTPRVQNCATAMSTPTINNILFGNTLDTDYNKTPKSAGQYLQKCKDSASDIDIFEDFYYKETVDVKNVTENDSSTVFKPPQPLKYDLKDFSCKICDKKFVSEKGIKIHFIKCHSEKIVVPKRKVERLRRICDHCGRDYHDRSTLIKHIQSMHINKNSDSDLVCEYCSLKFSKQSSLEMHKRNIHLDYRNKTTKTDFKYICSVCGSQFKSSSNYRLHMARHNKNYSMFCSECGKGFYRKSELEMHERVHLGLRVFGCPKCNKSFARREWLNCHLKKHNDEYPFKCEVCGDRFVKLAHLNKHKTTKKCLNNRVKVAIQRYQEMQRNGKPTYYCITEEKHRPKIRVKKFLAIDGNSLFDKVTNKDAIKVIDSNEMDTENEGNENLDDTKVGNIALDNSEGLENENTSENHEQDDEIKNNQDQGNLDNKESVNNETTCENEENPDASKDTIENDEKSDVSNNAEMIQENSNKTYELPDLGYHDVLDCDNGSENCKAALEADSKVNDDSNISGKDIETLLKM